MRQYYLKVKNTYRNLIRDSKSENILRKINASENRTRTIWQVINDNKSGKSQTHKLTGIVKDDGEVIKKPILMANTLNEFFVKVGGMKTVESRLKAVGGDVADSFFFRPVTEKEVELIAKGLTSKNSASSDGISSIILKETVDLLSMPLSHLINTSFQQGKFPTALKLAIIKPIKKNKSENSCNNFRPISILSTISKVFEKVVLTRLCDFLEKNNVLFKNQFGFVKNKTTVHAMFTLISNITRCLDSKLFNLGVFFDLSRAFDNVNHDLLLKKLSMYGIRGLAQDWFRSYLTNRKQYVEITATDNYGYIRAHCSEEQVIASGVPQGSVLGPVLFLLFINDLPSSITSGELCLFADDTSLSVSGTSMEDLEIRGSIEANHLLQWFDENLLSLNADKTKILDFHISTKRAQNNIGINILLGENQIEAAQSVKFLGLHLDDALNFHSHVEVICGRVSSGIFLLRRLSRIAGVEVMLSAYYGVVYSHLNYAVSIWGAENSRTLFLFRLQKRAVRAIFGLRKRQSCREIFRVNNLLTFPSMYILSCLIFVKENLSSFTIPISSAHNHFLRNSSDLKVPHHRTSFFKNHLFYNGIIFFNKLPLELKLESNLLKFKNKFRAILVNESYYSVQEFLAGGSM